MKTLIKTQRELAKILDIHYNTVKVYMDKGMPYIIMGNGKKGFILEDVQRWFLGEVE